MGVDYRNLLIIASFYGEPLVLMIQNYPNVLSMRLVNKGAIHKQNFEFLLMFIEELLQVRLQLSVAVQWLVKFVRKWKKSSQVFFY